ncbi:hypothetical protein GCM10010345_70210 [Streptomyces canarius]|uniref:Uncharacterized protein n=2 Tax=Streptomyces TaxID=1883 RepID=A0ABQ3D8V7_9ACTN|nr:hypothetical protein GCM10010345_70210 [Streptomyces canarius]
MEASRKAAHDTSLPTVTPEGPAMYALELHRLRSAELRRTAQEDRLAREAVRSRRAARRAEPAADGAPAAESHTDRPRRHRLPRIA